MEELQMNDILKTLKLAVVDIVSASDHQVMIQTLKLL